VIALKHGIADEDFDFLGTGTEQELDDGPHGSPRRTLAAGQNNGPRPPAPSAAQGTAANGLGPVDPAQQFAALVQAQLRQ
jgi:hypothetical protein